MADNHDYIGLEWVRGEIDQTLTQAQNALESFVENKEDSTQLSFCLNYIHQVHGTLQMVEFYGASLLAEEMEKLCQKLLDNDVASFDEALEVLIGSLIQLQNYLEHIQAGQKDLPVVLLPTLNDLRAAQGQPLLSDTSLFTPDLSASFIERNVENNKRMDDPQVVANLRKLRQMFQVSLVGVIRNQNLAENFAYLYKVLARLEKFCHDTPIGKVWWVAVGFLDALQEQQDNLSSATKYLLRELDYQLKEMIESPDSILSRPLPEDLLKNLLYYVAKTDISTKRVSELKEAFSLNEALPDEQSVNSQRERLMGPNQDTMNSVVGALAEELNQVKDQLDLYVRNQTKDKSALADQLPIMNQVANTLAVLGQGAARTLLLRQVTRIGEIVESDEIPDDQALLQIASDLLQIESALSSSGAGSASLGNEAEGDGSFVVPVEHFENAHDAVIHESKNALEQAKNSISGFIASKWDHKEIEDVPDLLDSIRGGLQIIPLTRAATLLKACSHYIRENILNSKAIPDWEQLDRLADAITSIEYYMERVKGGAKDNDRILSLAESSLARLGALEEGAPEATNENAVSEHHTSEIASESPDAVVKESDDALIDEEILGIFVEEVDEVRELAEQSLDGLRNNPEDSESLQELRRAFHTLKGSGRLVGAGTIGEIGWSVENLLNRYIEKKHAPDHEDFALVDKALAKLPSLVEAFSNSGEELDVSAIVTEAENRLALFNGEPVISAGSNDAPADENMSEDTVSEDGVQNDDHTESIETSDEPEETEVIAASAQEAEPLSEPAPSLVAPVDDDDDLIDDEILEIFIEEAQEVSETIDHYLPTFLAEFDNSEALTELRRAYHTLKGSGRMVGAGEIGETAWSIENMLNRVIDGTILMNQDIADIVKLVSGIIPDLVESFKAQTPSTLDIELIQSTAEALSKGELVQNIANLLGETSKVETPSKEAASADDQPAEVEVQNDTVASALGNVGVDETLLEIFESEVTAHIQTVEDFVRMAKASEEPVAVNDALSRSMHTLKGSAKTAGIDCIAEVAVPTEKFVKELRARQFKVDHEIAELLAESMAIAKDGVNYIHGDCTRTLDGTEAYLSKLTDIQEKVFAGIEDDIGLDKTGGQDPQLVSIFLTEGLDILLDAEKILDEWSSNPLSSESLDRLFGEVKTLHRGAKVASLDPIAQLCAAIEKGYDRIDPNGQPDPGIIDLAKRAHEALINMMDQVAAGLAAEPDTLLLEELEAFAELPPVEISEPIEAKTDDDLNDKLDELDSQLTDVISSYGDEQSDDIDDELIEIFLEEARDILQDLDGLIQQIQTPEPSSQALQQLERDFHTLKGGARMAKIEPIGDLANALENAFHDAVHGQIVVDETIQQILVDSQSILQGHLHAIESQSALASVTPLLARIEEALRPSTDTQSEEHASEAEEANSPEPTAAELPDGSEVEETPESVVDESADDNVPVQEPVASISSALMDLDPELVDIFLEEAQDIIENSGTLLSQWETDTHNLDLVAELQRELHTLKGGARMAEVTPIGDMAHELETLFEHIVESRYDAESSMIRLCLECHDALANMVEAVASSSAMPDTQGLLAQIKSLVETGSVDGQSAAEETSQEESVEEAVAEVPDAPAHILSEEDLESDLLPMFLDESKDILISVSEFLEQWRDDDSTDAPALELQREMHTLKGGARLADIDPIADIAQAAEMRLTEFVDGSKLDRRDLMMAIDESQSVVGTMLEALLAGEPVAPRPDIVKRMAMAGGDAPKAPAKKAATTPELLPDDALDGLDLEVLEIFVEEARELCDALEEQMSKWGDAPQDDDCNREIQRVLHTLKGGARLSDLTELADESHDLETELVAALDKGTPFEGDFKQSVMASQDKILKLVDAIEQKASGKAAPEAPAPKVEAPAQTPATPAPAPVAASAKPVKAKPAKKASPAKDTEAKPGAQETIRVSSSLMEELVNLAGETSISRGRLETQISDFGFTLEEMAATIERLREQLRRMDMETEAQVLFRAEKDGLTASNYEDFDPLEMDRYSSIQQLSRSLSESATDLMELRDTLSDRTRGAETLLLQQSRINSELQEGLMKTRMIPFSSMVPRLRRIARQIGGELNKEVNFSVTNAEGEMDRSVLERMIAPLEHMLRNALDHGIEDKAERVKVGKPEAGNVRLSLSREGGDVVLRMRDDGAGINDKKVFEKAVSQGLIKKNAQVSRHDILQFIMLPGFSTAAKVTQISGRGVGMDVVASEIKQMGGSIEIESTLGQGTEFTVRLPFTVSVNRALMVNIGDDFYAIPLNTIEGIVRVSSFELEEYYKPDAPLYEYAGREYSLQYLGKLLHSGHQPKLQGQPLPLPVILVRGADKPMALQVDSLMGSREIVVKSLGPQFGGVQAVSGATILGDGSVVVILDLPALIRDESAGILDGADEVKVQVEKESETPLVMVVDDSVTVRKVSTRLLERNGMDVVTAKDGVDAIAQLQDCKPDVMLLDIEMPRMDGFEVATLVRHDERLKDVPIIMITSRTGQKHRERALSIGVNEYLGKPFQEQQLLETIEKLVHVKA